MSTSEPIHSESPAQSPELWIGRHLPEGAWRVPVPAAVIEELEAALEAQPAAQPQPTSTPEIACWLQRLRDPLLRGHGIAVSGALPVARWGLQRARRAVEILASAFGPPVAQTRDGTRFYDVRDHGLEPAPGVRRSLTNVEQAFHTDGPWVRRPPGVISLYCLRAASEGGVSRCISLGQVVHDLAAEAPELAARLEQDFLWHRQGEHASEDTPVSRLPMVWHDDHGQWAMRCYTDYVRSGYRAAGVTLDPLGERALLRIDQLCAQAPRRVEFKLAEGEVLWVNNRRCAHARTRFEPASSSPRPRRLVRVWHRLDGEGIGLED